MNSSDLSSRRPGHPHGTAASSEAAPVPPVVALAALYGAGGSVVGPPAAEQLGVPFLDRGILAGVAVQMGVPEEAADLRRQELDRAKQRHPSLL